MPSRVLYQNQTDPQSTESCIANGSTNKTLQHRKSHTVWSPSIITVPDKQTALVFYERDGKELFRGYLTGESMYISASTRIMALEPLVIDIAPTELDKRAEATIERRWLAVYGSTIDRIRAEAGWLAESYENNHPEGVQIKLTRSDMAAMVGCSREMVGRSVKKLEREGVLKWYGVHLTILRAPREYKRSRMAE